MSTATPTTTDRLWWYAVVDHGSRIPELVGVDGTSRVFTLPTERVDLVVSPADPAVLAATSGEVDERTAALAVEHDRVIGAVAAHCAAVLPVRFGTVVDPTSAQHLDDGTARSLATALDTVRDKLEYGVRVVRRPRQDASSEDAAASGAAYLTAVRDRRRRADQKQAAADDEIASLRDTLTRVSDAATSLTTRRPGHLMNEAYLVATGRADEFLSLAEAARPRLAAADAELIVTGPWAPYSFAAVSGGGSP